MFKALKYRMLTNWTLIRAIYLIMGFIVLLQSVMVYQLAGILFGTYFMSMGLFAFGCASGSCFGGQCTTEDRPINKNISHE
ncbi:MAG: hypothetical protein KGN97_06230 [Bacteroidota bacterium]|jgi:hypothetical protein|nr:hypothetical protein [Bacteroidota bacterium]